MLINHQSKQGSKCCLLCFNKKSEIAKYKKNKHLNKKTKMINTWRHGSKYKYPNSETID